jgi:hypothetical protein
MEGHSLVPKPFVGKSTMNLTTFLREKFGDQVQSDKFSMISGMSGMSLNPMHNITQTSIRRMNESFAAKDRQQSEPPGTEQKKFLTIAEVASPNSPDRHDSKRMTRAISHPPSHFDTVLADEREKQLVKHSPLVSPTEA